MQEEKILKAKNKKRKLKKGFKLILTLFVLVILASLIYFLNARNIISLNNIYNKSNTFVKNIFHKENKTVEGQIEDAVDINDFSDLFRVRLSSKGLEYASSSPVSQNGDMKIYINNTRDSLSYLYVNTKDRAEYVWITFVSAIDAEPLKTSIQNNLKNLEYIDLRFDNKVFYKFRDTSINISTSSNIFKPKIDTKPESVSSSSILLPNTQEVSSTTIAN